MECSPTKKYVIFVSKYMNFSQFYYLQFTGSGFSKSLDPVSWNQGLETDLMQIQCTPYRYIYMSISNQLWTGPVSLVWNPSGQGGISETLFFGLVSVVWSLHGPGLKFFVCETEVLYLVVYFPIFSIHNRFFPRQQRPQSWSYFILTWRTKPRFWINSFTCVYQERAVSDHRLGFCQLNSENLVC